MRRGGHLEKCYRECRKTAARATLQHDLDDDLYMCYSLFCGDTVLFSLDVVVVVVVVVVALVFLL